MNIRIGKERFQPKRGVMQGSPISPYLFDIYIKELMKKIKTVGALRDECVLMYADDLAVICYN